MISVDHRSGALAVLDSLRTAQDLQVDRADEARGLVEHLRGGRAPITVLHGAVGSGKSELVRRWVVPMLAESGARVTFLDTCDPPAEQPLPAGEGEVFEFRDRFEHCLTTAQKGDDSVVSWLREVASGRGGRRVVLIIRDEALSTMFQLGTTVPRLLEDIREIPALSGGLVSEALRRAMSRVCARVAPDVLDAIVEDFAATSLHAPPSTELVACVAFELGRHDTGDELRFEEYLSRGRLMGVLERHLQYLFGQLPAELDAQLAWALLSDSAATGVIGQSHFEEVAVRFDSSIDAVMAVVHWLHQTRGVLRQAADGPDFHVVPPQLAMAAAARTRREAATAERSAAMLRAGVRQFKDTEALLSDHHFRKIHADRTALHVSDDEAKLMLRCALLYESDTPEVSSHWLRRIKDPRVQAEVLLDALFDARADVRSRAAAELRAFPFPEVRSQLHLIALRDDTEAVRANAINSLASMRDEGLLRSLAREIHDRQSPYRLQAIEVLRVFDEPAASLALERVISEHPAGEDRDARRLAVRVLGQQNTVHSANALLDIALNDPDDEDRECAADALACSTNEDTLRAMLDRIRQPQVWRDAPTELQVAGIPATIAAAAVVLSGWLIHGLALATLRRWRLAAAVTGVEAMSFAVGAAGWQDAASILFWVSAFIGMLVPLKILIGERLDRHQQGAYRRALGRVLFVVNAFSSFLLLHGLAAMLARQTRRGIALFALQSTGLFPIFAIVTLYARMDPFLQLSPILVSMVLLFLLGGVAILICSWLLGLFRGMRPAFMLRRRVLRLERARPVYDALTENPIAARLLVEPVAGGSGRESWRARLFRSCGTALDLAFREAWEKASPEGRRHLFRAATRRRDPAGQEFLRNAVKTLGFTDRARFMWAAVAYRLALWPKPLLTAIAIAIVVQFAVTVALIEISRHDPARLAETIRSRGVTDDDRQHAVRDLWTLALLPPRDPGDGTAPLRRPEAVSAEAILNDSLTERFDMLTDTVRTDLLEAVAAVAPTSDEAVRALGDFVLNGPSNRGRAKVGQAEDEVTLVWQRRGVEKLQQLAEHSPIAFELLRRIETDRTIDKHIQDAARTAADAADPLTRAESHVQAGRYIEANEIISKVIGGLTQDRQRRALQIAADAYIGRARIAHREKDFFAARDNLIAAVENGPAPQTIPSLVALGLELAFHFHEVLALEDPAQFENVHLVLSKMESLPLPDDLRQTVQANLAEASLTTSRFDDAAQRARVLLDSTDASTALNMRYLRFAAYTCVGNMREAEAARRELDTFRRKLDPTFTNTWVYAGTRRYISAATLPQDRKDLLLSVLAEIEGKR